MRALLLCALLVMPVVAHAGDPWSRGDQIREALYLAVTAADAGQTLDIHNHPGFSEANRILGPYPKRGKIASYFIGLAIVHTGIVDVLPKKWRPLFQMASIFIEANAVNGNRQIGLHFNF